MGAKQLDVWWIIGLAVSIILVIISPSIPKLDIITVSISLSILIVILILIIFYLNLSNKMSNTEKRNRVLMNKYKEIKDEVSFLKERFKTIEDFATLKAKVDLLDKRRR